MINTFRIGEMVRKRILKINPFNLKGRYPEMWEAVPSREEADALIQKTKELFEWLKNQLSHQQGNTLTNF